MRARAQTCPLTAPVRSHALAHHPHIRPATLELLRHSYATLMPLLRHARTCTVYRDRPTGLLHMHSIFPVHTSGATYKAPGGCWQPFCDPSNPEQSQSTDGSLCGFGGNDAVRNAWRPEDLGTVLDLYAEHSQPYREVRAGSGSPDRINLGSSSANCVDTFPILSPHSCLRLTPPTLPYVSSPPALTLTCHPAMSFFSPLPLSPPALALAIHFLPSHPSSRATTSWSGRARHGTTTSPPPSKPSSSSGMAISTRRAAWPRLRTLTL